MPNNLFPTIRREFPTIPWVCQGEVLNKPKLVDQLFREGLRVARVKFLADRGETLTPEGLGRMVGVSDQTIRNYESGDSEPTLVMIEKIRLVLKAPAEWPPFASYAPKNDDGEQLPQVEMTRVERPSGAKRRRRGRA